MFNTLSSVLILGSYNLLICKLLCLDIKSYLSKIIKNDEISKYGNFGQNKKLSIEAENISHSKDLSTIEETFLSMKYQLLRIDTFTQARTGVQITKKKNNHPLIYYFAENFNILFMVQIQIIGYLITTFQCSGLVQSLSITLVLLTFTIMIILGQIQFRFIQKKSDFVLSLITQSCFTIYSLCFVMISLNTRAGNTQSYKKDTILKTKTFMVWTLVLALICELSLGIKNAI